MNYALTYVEFRATLHPTWCRVNDEQFKASFVVQRLGIWNEANTTFTRYC
jgi:hypothetical protein